MGTAGATADELTRFARAALRMLSHRHGGLEPAGRALALDASDGGANHLLQVRCVRGRVVVKMRADEADDGASEGWALARAPALTCPSLLALTTAVELRARAAREQHYSSLRDLNASVGGVIVLSHIVGRPPSPASLDDVRAVAAAIARLHGRRIERGPRVRTGSSRGALISLGRRLLDDVERHQLVDVRARRALGAALRTATKQTLAARSAPRVRTLCHGDLRWHNTLVLPDGGARLLDLEHAGVGDPAVDLALMSCRTPLSELQELTVLDAYLEVRRDASLLDRYFALKPLLGLVGALAGVVDLALVKAGRRACVEDKEAYVRRRSGAAELELDDALCALRPRGTQRVTLTLPQRRARPASTPLGRCAVDGTASSGKSVLARAVAEHFRVPYFNTGAAYRFAALLALENGLRPGREQDVERLTGRLARVRAALDPDGGIRVGRGRLDAALYAHEIDLVVARFAADPRVRRALAAVIAPALAPKNVVVEGRDVGSVLLPRARGRLFIDALPKVRAERTLERLGRRLSLRTVERALTARDTLDRERAVAPLVLATGAVLLDTSRLSEAAAVARALEVVGR